MSSTLDIQQLLPIKEELDEWSPDMEQQVPQLLSIKKEEEEEADITDFPLAAAVKSENEEKVHSLFHHVKNEYKDEEEPQTSSSGQDLRTCDEIQTAEDTTSNHHDAPASYRLLSPLQPNTPTYTSMQHPQQIESVFNVFYNEDAAFQKLLTLLTELTREVRDLREEVRAFNQSCSNEPLDAGGLPLDLPLHNMDELNNAEATLQLPESYKTMVRRFSLIGGTTLEVRVRRILAYVITNELASGLNWAGRKTKDQTKQKRAFKETALCRCIFDGLTQQVGVNAVSEFAFAQAVQKWLCCAPDRMGGAGRRISSPIPE
ncbi:uncharacterized protein LOC106097621 [Oreochromis niloticus]|uniref:uncharacterized protein LOC106097621 n=1 Tax=Oreochromis niloticus TaxID=8128 RepID=UPI000674967E|nr:uncharacterized protein LOC106097621 [Oreochromis niloticus]CAI5658032.1 unnamed protein product [Mustela putorius furo]CAI5658034.1 unnamed protein product [Mustela putorius furo]